MLFPLSLWAQVAARRLRRVSAQLAGRRRSAGVSSASRSGGGIPEHVSGREVYGGSGVDHLGCAAGAGSHGALAAGSGRSGVDGGAGISRCGGRVPRRGGENLSGAGRFRGLESRRWATTVARQRPRLVYVTPAHQFPLGVTMSLRRRLSLLEWARRSRTIIFEDDYDSEYRYSGRPIPALQGLDRAAVVIFAGSFTDVLFPALRLAYLVVPADMVDIFAAAESVSTHHPPLIDQAILCDFIREGHFARHVRRMRELYAERLSVLVESARERLAGLLEIPAVEAGLRTVGWLQGGILAERAAQAAAKYDVEVVPLSRYAYGPCAARRDRAWVCGGGRAGTSAGSRAVGAGAGGVSSLELRTGETPVLHSSIGLRTWRTFCGDRWR